MQTTIVFLAVFGFMGAFCAFYRMLEISMSNLRKRKLKKLFMKRHALNG